MTPDDPRHGTPRGHYAGCREACCRAARCRYEKAGRLDRLRGGRAIPALGYQRRIKALMALGWSYQALADAAGWAHRNHVRRVVEGQKGKPTRYLERATASTIGEVFERLCMTVPQGPYAKRTRMLAARKGYLPPLAWDDIDDPNERPAKVYSHAKRVDRDHVDPIVIERVLAGDRQPMTTKERREVVARARALGWSEETIYARTGIAKATDAARYGEREAS